MGAICWSIFIAFFIPTHVNQNGILLDRLDAAKLDRLLKNGSVESANLVTGDSFVVPHLRIKVRDQPQEFWVNKNLLNRLY